MSEVDHPAKRSLFQRLCDAERENAELRATIEAYKAEVEGARNAALEAAAQCVDAWGELNHAKMMDCETRFDETSARMYGNRSAALADATTQIRALKTTPTGGE